MKIRLWSTNLKIRLFGESLFNMLYWMYFPFITVYFSEVFGLQTAGLMMTVPPLFSLAGSLIGGYMADRLGRRTVMLIGTALQTIMFALFAASTHHVVDYAAFIGIGLGSALYKPASSAMVADLVPQEDRRQVFAAYTTANNLGAVLGPALGAVFFFEYRQELLWCCTSIMLIYSALILFFVHESKPEYDTDRTSSHSFMSLLREQWTGYGIIFRDKMFLLYLLAGIFSLISIMQLDLYLAVYITNYVPAQSLISMFDIHIQLEHTEILGWVLGLNGLMFVMFVLPVTRWLRPVQDRNVFILSALLTGIGTFLLGLGTNIWYLFGCTIIFTIGEIVRSPVMHSFISHYAPEHARGQYMGADHLQYIAGRLFAPVTVFLSASVAPLGIFSLIFASSMISALLYYGLFRGLQSRGV